MQILVRDSDRLILQYGQSLPPAGAGQSLEEVSDATRDALRAAYAQPNGGIAISADHQTITALPYVPPVIVNPFDSPKAALDAWQAAIVTDTANLTSGRAGFAALNPATVTNIASAVTYLTAEKAALLVEIDALHATLTDMKNAINALVGVVITLRSNSPPST